MTEDEHREAMTALSAKLRSYGRPDIAEKVVAAAWWPLCEPRGGQCWQRPRSNWRPPRRPCVPSAPVGRLKRGKAYASRLGQGPFSKELSHGSTCGDA
jgi:hypothetical protein